MPRPKKASNRIRLKKKPVLKKSSKNKLIIISACFVFIILTVFGAFLSVYGNSTLIYEGQQEKESILSAYRGTLTPTYPINISQPFIVSIGTIYTSYTVDELAKGIDLTKFIIYAQPHQFS